MTKSVFSKKYKILREMLAEERLKANLSQRELSDRMGVVQTFVSKYELGERRIDVVELAQILEAMGINPIKFFEKWYKSSK
ncbi:MAG: helix-turn-helix domain-containing protein [Lactobacillus sp.]|jgi:transcriptional regulator with XRE-family HTH domain|nr:helix-turn-helix domain-containing protein [Lactobacillus sp.]